jgi:hypothetical protein
MLTSAASDVFHSYDTGNIALAADNYNIAEERPHLPGYFLYVMLIRFVNIFSGSTHTSIILLQVLFSAAGITLLYVFLRDFAERKTALMVTFFIATNPLVRFFGGTTEIYSFDLFFSVLLVLAGTRQKYIYLLPVIFAVGAGIRQRSAQILLPLYIYFWYNYLKATKNYKLFAYSNVIGILIFFTWLAAMLATAGGIQGYIELMKSQNPVPSVSIVKNVAQMITMGLWFIIPLCIIWLVVKIKDSGYKQEKQIKIIINLWLLPAVFMFILVHYTRGYWLIALGGIALWLITLSRTAIARSVLILFTILQTAYFFLMPFKLETAEIFYVPTQRHLNAVEVAYERMLSVNSLTLAHIRYVDRTSRAVFSAGERYKRHKYILLDPSLPIYARALQAGSKERFLFAELNLVRPDGYFLYKDLKQWNLAGRRQLIDSSLIVGIEPFVRNINRDYIKILGRDGQIVFYVARKSKIRELKQIYNKYFQKR